MFGKIGSYMGFGGVTPSQPSSQSGAPTGTLGDQPIKQAPPEKRYTIGVHSTPGFGLPTELAPQHHSLSFKKETVGSDGSVQEKRKYVGMGVAPGTEDGSRYNHSVDVSVTKEQYKAVKQSAKKEVSDKLALPPLQKAKDYFVGDGNCQDLTRRNLEKHGVPYPEEAAKKVGIRNESFYHQPPLTPQQKKDLEARMERAILMST